MATKPGGVVTYNTSFLPYKVSSLLSRGLISDFSLEGKRLSRHRLLVCFNFVKELLKATRFYCFVDVN